MAFVNINIATTTTSTTMKTATVYGGGTCYCCCLLYAVAVGGYHVLKWFCDLSADADLTETLYTRAVCRLGFATCVEMCTHVYTCAAVCARALAGITSAVVFEATQ